MLRLGVVERKIAEIETLVIRNKDAAESLDKIAHTTTRVVHRGARVRSATRGTNSSRIANMYFSGIELNDGKGVYPLHEACARLENGAVTAGDPAAIPGCARRRHQIAHERAACSSFSPACFST